MRSLSRVFSFDKRAFRPKVRGFRSLLQAFRPVVQVSWNLFQAFRPEFGVSKWTRKGLLTFGRAFRRLIRASTTASLAPFGRLVHDFHTWGTIPHQSRWLHYTQTASGQPLPFRPLHQKTQHQRHSLHLLGLKAQSRCLPLHPSGPRRHVIIPSFVCHIFRHSEASKCSEVSDTQVGGPQRIEVSNAQRSQFLGLPNGTEIFSCTDVSDALEHRRH